MFLSSLSLFLFSWHLKFLRDLAEATGVNSQMILFFSFKLTGERIVKEGRPVD
jgi:hypothetical protein